MKIQIVSDLHFEFEAPPDIINAGADVLVLGGDICVAEHFYNNPRNLFDANGQPIDMSKVINKNWYGHDVKKWRKFFDHLNNEWNHVIYIIGNHEHYSGRWDRTESVLREEFTHYPNIHLLEMNSLIVDNVQFLGASLWTDFNNHDPLTILSAKDLMNDYKAIADFTNNSYRKLHPQTTLNKHVETKSWLKHMLKENDLKTVICTHHVPSRQSLHPRFANQGHMNGCFMSNCEDIMLDNENVVLWSHGHVHDPWDYNIEQCRVICNPRGYPGEGSRASFNPNLVVEV